MMRFLIAALTPLVWWFCRLLFKIEFQGVETLDPGLVVQGFDLLRAQPRDLEKVHQVKQALYDMDTRRMLMEEELTLKRLGYKADEIKARLDRGDQFVVRFKLDVTPKGQKRIHLDEVGLYTVRNGRIVEESFFMGGR